MSGPSGRPAPVPEVAQLFTRLLALGLQDVDDLRLTHNRTVMVGLTRGRVLSLHRGYLHAPDRVLRAIVRFLAPRTTRELRRAAQHEILGFHPEQYVPSLERGRSVDRPQAGDDAVVARLETLFTEYNRRYFDGALPRLPIRLSGRMRTRLGQLALSPDGAQAREITISRRHLHRHGWDEASHTLLHEMVHLWQHAQGLGVDHGPRFRRKAAEVGVTASARRWVRTPAQRRVARTD